MRASLLRTRLLACLLSCTLAFVAFAACVQIAKNAHHDCQGDGCATCQAVAAGGAALLLAAAPEQPCACAPARSSASAPCAPDTAERAFCWSLIVQKTRIDI